MRFDGVRQTLTGGWLTGLLPLLCALIFVPGCSSNSTTEPSTPTFTFTQSPIPPALITSITPLGNLAPPFHTLATDHMLFFHLPTRIDVVAPAAGTILEVRRGSDDAISVQLTPGTYYYLSGIQLDTGMVAGSQVTVGQHLGVTVSTGAPLEFGLANNDVTLFFVRPERYNPQTIHADSPLKHFTDPTRSTLYAKVDRNSTDKDGRIEFDQSGRLVGNWFLEGLPVGSSADVENGTFTASALVYLR